MSVIIRKILRKSKGPRYTVGTDKVMQSLTFRGGKISSENVIIFKPEFFYEMTNFNAVCDITPEKLNEELMRLQKINERQ